MKVLAALFIMASCSSSDNGTDAWGNFETRETIISSQANGRLIQLDLQQGQTLAADTMVGLIDTLQLALNRNQLMARRQAIQVRFQETDANVAVLKARQANLEREIARTRSLLQDQAATRQQLEDLQGQLEVLQQQIQAAQVARKSISAEVQALDAQLEQVEEQLSHCYIMNPMEGVVLEKYVERHELVMPGKPLYKIADLSTMDLRVYVSGSQLPHIKLGQQVKVYIDEDEESNRELQGTLHWISSKAEFTPKTIQTKEERVSQVYAVIVKVPNDGSIKIGMPGEVIF